MDFRQVRRSRKAGAVVSDKTLRMAAGASETQRTVYERGDRRERTIGFIQLINVRGVKGWRFLANKSDVVARVPTPAIPFDTPEASFESIVELLK